MNIVLLLFISFSLSKQCNETRFSWNHIETVDSAFECIESIQTTEDENTDIINELKYYLNAYVFKDILKNPPQPSFSNNYYEKVDIDSELDKINTKTTSLYEFYSEIKNLIISTRDPNLAFSIDYSLKKPNSEFRRFRYFLPFTINIDNDKKMYLNPRNELPRITTYSVGVDVPEEIINNQNVSVITINGEDPFNFIRKFGKKYVGLKCPHAQFTEAKSAITYGLLGRLPLTKEYLNTPITIIWENGERLTVNYNMYVVNDSWEQTFQEAFERSKRRGIRNGIRKEKSEEGNERKRIKQENDEYKPNCSEYEEICCLTTSNKVNTLIVKSFFWWDNYLDKLTECLDKFDSNDYPIQVIFPQNGRGYSSEFYKEKTVPLAQIIEKVLSPYDDFDYILSARISGITENKMKHGYGIRICDPETCESRERRGVNSSTFSELNEYLYRYPKLKLIRYPRKPTEIVVYTDSYCHSACSLVTKGLKEWGRAILVGFDGDPYGKDEEFEVGVSPTEDIFNINEIDSNNSLKQNGYKLELTFTETYRFNYKYDETIPREFLIDMIDERVDIYQFSNDKIKEFEEETKKIVEKYKTKCNPKNKRLVKRDEKCDEEINKKHGHGGYECGDNGEWSTKCVLAYCDSGYKFDYIKNKCIEDVCSNALPISIINVSMVIIGIIALIL
ncbi:hypothetical protein CL6EHI_179700 [Entamoeba histolytica]|uniref:EGF-like domain-containing protein n=2 Tax=Entamoeba histolytica TaxID=5759 RepID=C4MB49_ENTH1|nr:hypothetical protein EHI_179700 [Entamoeba histolytica HM-1:IMSS]EAL49880.2 hypothetical protein EHI_179700 [Entamoeba histolytica HM-1:IMSS]GAT99133.1 hypothetical protein CL6EHI_179700 [Entamoeba histolytica]|eukprot:XP_655266.2 hypothetical protein EHI_179700 [Entamoeba histolytica HM-1:IMSS]